MRAEHPFYQVVNETSVYFLERQINEMIQDGWVPQGSVGVYNGRHYQAMVKMDQSHIEEMVKKALDR